ncbi:MAG: DUF4430 domain-containing protein [Coriobacteriia bacterium]|nr:DUF4430 domain-containing protein [Coriobacteriia bacterium]
MTETNPHTEEMTDVLPHAEDMQDAPPQAEPKRKRPTGKIAVLASFCVALLGVSVWGLVTAQMPSDAILTASEQQSSSAAADRDTNANSGSSGSESIGGEKPEDEGSGSGSSPASADGSTGGGTAGGGTGGGDSGQGGGAGTDAGTGGGGGGTGGGSTGGGTGGGSSPPPDPGASTAPQPINVTLSISCYVAIEAGSATAHAVSDNGAMRYATLRLNAGTTVYDALVASGAVLSTSGVAGTPMGIYVSAIDGLGEGEAGPQSGWKFYVNGSAPGMSCDRYVLSNGDTVEWRYVTNA